MASNKYKLKLSAKTRTLNFFRRIFTISFIEKIIASASNTNPTLFWKKIVPPEYLYKEGSIRKAKRDGVNFVLDISNTVEHGIYFFGIQSKGFSSAFDDIRKSKTILDVGAFVGTASIIFTQLNPNARIFAFEPNPESFRKAMVNQSINNFKNISIFNSGMGSKPGKLKLYFVDSHNAGMNRILSGDQDFPYAEVDITTIDEFVDKQQFDSLDFIKFDVEGFEYEAIRGGERTLRKFLPVLFIELDDNNLRDNNQSAGSLISLLNSYGYTKITRAGTGQVLNENTNFTNCHYDILVK